MEWNWYDGKLSRFLDNLRDDGKEELRDYLIRTKQPENLDFLETVQVYKEIEDREERKERAAYIFREFLIFTAQRSINVSHSAVANAKVLARSGESDAFEAAETEVESLLRNTISLCGIIESPNFPETTRPRQARSVSEPAWPTNGDFKKLSRDKIHPFTRSSDALTLASTLGLTVKCKKGDVTLCENTTTSCIDFIARMKKLACVDGEFGVWITSEKAWMDERGNLSRYVAACADPNTRFVLKKRDSGVRKDQ